MPTHVLGVRHHGPGSARSVLAALEELAPDVVVIEGPPELDSISAWAADPALVPPVAALVYDPTRPACASFYPMADFSPEWVALRWALEHDVPVRFADLPATHALALRAQETAADDARDAGTDAPDAAGARPTPQDPAGTGQVAPSPAGPPPADAAPVSPGEVNSKDPADPGTDEPSDAAAAPAEDVRQDPLAILAAAAGQSDPERWWEDAIEQRFDSPTARFVHVLDAMRELRAAHPGLSDEENERREAAMRRVLREVQAEHGVVAVVCGAFHAPALDPAGYPAKAADNRLLTRLPKAKVGLTWVPWTSSRLARASGYGAGVRAPGWYAHLFREGDRPSADVAASWLVGVGRALRAEAQDASPASVVEATRLAEALAALRERPSPGLDEMNDAGLAVLCGGHPERLSLVAPDLLVGPGLGEVPDDVPTIPLAADLAAQQRSLRLKPSATSTEVTLDLRQPAQLARSVLFHRLLLLDVPWAVRDHRTRSAGTFKEEWRLEWRPELSVAVVEAGLYGTTVESACLEVLKERAADAELPVLSELVAGASAADLPAGLLAVVVRLEERAARTHDARELLDAIEPLARTLRYGTVRGKALPELGHVLAALVARATVGLGAACHNLDDDAARGMREALDGAERGLRLLDDPALTQPWVAALLGLGEDVHGAVAGRVTRLLLDSGALQPEEARRRLSRRLSPAVPPQQSAAWLEAFLSGEAMLLVHDPELLGAVDEWVSGIGEEVFEDLLPVLRRTFADLEAAARRHLAAVLARPGHRHTSTLDRDDERALPAMRAVAALLGQEMSV